MKLKKLLYIWLNNMLNSPLKQGALISIRILYPYISNEKKYVANVSVEFYIKIYKLGHWSSRIFNERINSLLYEKEQYSSISL